MPSRRVDTFRWDPLVRVVHWGIVFCCAVNLWFDEAGEALHEQLGYLVMVLIGVRLLWGATFAGKYARLGALWPTLTELRQQREALRDRQPPAPGHHGSGKLAVWALWLTVLATAFTGWLQNTDAGFSWGADEWHEGCVWLLQGLIALHLAALIYTSWRQRSNLVRRMLPGRD